MKTKFAPYIASSVFFVVVLGLTWNFARAEQTRFNEKKRLETLDRLTAVRAKLEAAINHRLSVAEGLAAYASTRPTLTQSEFTELARVLVDSKTGIRTVVFSKGTILSYYYPLKGNESAIGTDIMDIPDQREVVENTIRTRKTLVAGPVELVQGGIAFLSRTPVFITTPNQEPSRGEFLGLIMVIISQDRLLEDGGLLAASNEFKYALRGRDSLGAAGEVFFGDANIFQNQPVILNVTLPNGSWQLAGIPGLGWSQTAPSSVWVSFGGGAIALLGGMVVFLLVREPVRLREEIAERIFVENALRESKRSLEVAKEAAELANQATKASEAKLQEAHKLAHLGNWEWDLVTSQLYWSDELYQIFGLEKESPGNLSEKHRQQIYPDDFTIWEQAIHQLMTQGKPYELDFRIVRPTGEVRYIYAKGETIKNADGKVIKVFGTAQDISERKRVEEALRKRESDLQEKAVELEKTLQELRQTQSQLIQSEKMSSLGEMVAGIAHEINNPVSFIYSNIDPANEYVNDLLDLIHLYQDTYPNPTDEVEEKLEELDLEFLVEDLQKLLISMQNGARRIRDIVASLRNFSRLDESEIKEVDVHEGIESTLLILQHRFQGGQQNNAELEHLDIEVVKNYGILPPVVCYVNQLNQVFLNILNNAIDALKQVDYSAKNSEYIPTITITTKIIDKQRIEITIADNGTGIEPELASKIFDPFFTTKPVGSGTGLGLYVSYQIIVERHGGELTCVSNPGVGTEFMITMAIAPHQNRNATEKLG